jgi:acyl carrier protein
MNPSREQIFAIVYAALDELGPLIRRGRSLEKSPSTIIMDAGRGLDSLAFVNLVSSIELKLEQGCGVTLMLTQAESDGRGGNPFATVESIVSYIESLLQR